MVTRAARALTAAGVRIRLDQRDQGAGEARKRPLEWQKRVFDYYDSLGEARFAANWMGDALSRVRLVPAYIAQPGDDPVVLDERSLKDSNIDIPDAERELAWATVLRMTNGDGCAEIMRAAGINLFGPGEGYLVGRTTDYTEGVERWEVVSVDSLSVGPSGKGLAIKPYPDASGDDLEVLPDDSFVVRFMRRHPRYRDWPDSAMHAALDYCEDLRVLTMMIRATAMSRVSAGILGVPEEASFADTDDSTDPAEGPEEDALTRDLIKHMTTPLSDPQSAAAVVPFILRLAGEDLDRVKPITLDRPLDQLAVSLREETRRSFAASVDLPAEILVGRGDLNHWTAWAVTDEAFKIHVEPYAIGLSGAFTAAAYRPLLADAGVEEPGRHVLWYDPSGLVSQPDGSKTAIDLYDRVEISGRALRERTGIPEEDAPDDEELTRRTELASIIGKSKGTGAGQPAPDAAGPGNVDTGPPPSAVTGAGTSDAFDGLGVELARMEMALRERLRIAADEALRRGLERAGNRLRSLAYQDRAGLAASAVTNVAPCDVAATLGRAMVASLGTDPETLLAGTFDRVRERWDVWVKATQDEARRMVLHRAGLIAALVGADPAADQEWAAVATADRGEGWRIMEHALMETAAHRLFEPVTGIPSGPGEQDATSFVSPGVVRDALSVAGGGPVEGTAQFSVGAPTRDVGGLLSGTRMQDLLREAARAEFGNGYVWLYGDPASRTTPYEPHLALDGVTFTSWEDDVLSNTEDWPADPYFYPGDHDTCQCEVGREIVSSAAGAEDYVPTGDNAEPVTVRRVVSGPNAPRLQEAGARSVGAPTRSQLTTDFDRVNGLSTRTVEMATGRVDAIREELPVARSIRVTLKGLGGPSTDTRIVNSTLGVSTADKAGGTVIEMRSMRSVVDDVMRRSLNTGWFRAPAGADPYDVVFTHEYGHAVQHAVEQAYQAAGIVRAPANVPGGPVLKATGREAFRRDLYDIAARVWPGDTKEIARTLSGYAADGAESGSWGEVFAEAFQQLRMGVGDPKVRQFADEVNRLVARKVPTLGRVL